MKDSVQRKEKPYSRMIRKLFARTLIMMAAAVLLVIVMRNMVQGKMGNLVTEYICRWRNVDWEYAKYIYNNSMRKYLIYIVIALILIIFLLLFRVYLIWFTRYFDEITWGVDRLVIGDGRKIKLSPDLDFMSEKLNSVQDELRYREMARREAEQRKDDLVVYLAHDIKTPLTSVIGYLNLMEENPDMPVQQRAKYTHITLDKAYRLEKLINEFFEITRYNANGVTLNKEKINLSYMMLQICDEAYPVLSEGGKTIELHIDDDLELYADPDKMARVLNNLIKNAAVYGDEGCVIDVYTRPVKDGGLEIRVENPGYIPPESLNSIFDKFFRLDSARQTSTGGAGLGLAIAQDIIRLHGGSIWATCENNRIAFVILMP